MTTFASMTIGGRLASSFGVLEASRLPDTLIAGPLRVRITALFSITMIKSVLFHNKKTRDKINKITE